MSGNSIDLVHEFQGKLSETVSLLAKCRNEQRFAAHLHPTDVRVSSEGSNSIDRALLSLQESWLRSMDAESESYQAANVAEIVIGKCSNRRSLAQDAGLDLDQVRNIYEVGLMDEALELTKESSVIDSDLERLAKFGSSLLEAAGDIESPSVSRNLANIWYMDYKRKHADADDILETLSDDLERPFCHLSRKLLDKPVRAPCGHCFSENEIMTVFATNQRTTCPSSGCTGKFSADELQRDRLMDIQVKLWKQADEKRRLNETRRLVKV